VAALAERGRDLAHNDIGLLVVRLEISEDRDIHADVSAL
jgi:hypothetical protein